MIRRDSTMPGKLWQRNIMTNLPEAVLESYKVVQGSRGGDSVYEGVGMLVVSLRGVNFGFCTPLECSRQTTIVFSRKGLF